MKLRYLQNVVTLKLDADQCTGCGMCASVCPHEVFVITKSLSVNKIRDEQAKFYAKQ